MVFTDNFIYIIYYDFIFKCLVSLISEQDAA